MQQTINTIIILLLSLGALGILSALISDALRPDKEITVDIAGGTANVKSNIGRPGDKIIVVLEGDTIIKCEYDGKKWNEK